MSNVLFIRTAAASLLGSAGLLCAQSSSHVTAAPEAPRQLAARSLGGTPMLDDLRELCDGIGGRPTGSIACERSIQWAERKFREAGIDHVSVESFRVPNLWLPISAEAA